MEHEQSKRSSVRRAFGLLLPKLWHESERPQERKDEAAMPPGEAQEQDGEEEEGPAQRQGAPDEWDVYLPRAVPLDETAVTNAYTEPPASAFHVRGHGYLDGRRIVDRTLKAPSAEALYEVAGVNVFKTKGVLREAATKVRSLREILERGAEASPLGPSGEASAPFPQFLVVCWNFRNSWTREHTCVVHLFRRKDHVLRNLVEGGPLHRAFGEFLRGSQKQRAERLKFLFKVREAGAAVRRSVAMLGGEKPVLIARKLASRFEVGSNFVQWNHDVGSSYVAAALNSTMIKASAKMVVDYCWLLEAKEEEELPERLLCALRWVHVSLGDICVELDANFEPVAPRASK